MEKLTLHQKLLEIRKSVDYLKKESLGKQYKYVSSSQVLGNVRKKMDEYGVLLMPSVNNVNLHEKQESIEDRTRSTYFTELFMTMTWIDVDNSSDRIDLSWYGQGMDIAGEKGVGKALTYAEKYFILKFFNIATDKDDPDSFQNKYDKAKDTVITVKKEFAGKEVSFDKDKFMKEFPQAIKDFFYQERKSFDNTDDYMKYVSHLCKRNDWNYDKILANINEIKGEKK